MINPLAVQDMEMEALVATYRHALRSPDPSTQNAAVLTNSHGGMIHTTLSINEFPRGVISTPERWERPTKYSFVEHAERNCIYRAAYLGIPTEGKTMVSPWACCADCARGIIQAGIAKLVTHSPESVAESTHWDDSIDIAMIMLQEAGVKVEMIHGPLGGLAPILRNGELFTP